MLHRDISVGNIMIDVEPGPDGLARSFLNDWDLAKWEEAFNLNYGPSQPMGISVCLSFTSLARLLLFTYMHLLS